MIKRNITQEHWNNIFNKLTYSSAMSNDEIYSWMKERFYVENIPKIYQRNTFLDQWGFINPIGFPIRDLKQETEVNKMTTMRENAKNFIPKAGKNISELKEVSTEYEIKTKRALNNQKEEFEVNYFELEGEEYRVPDSVLKQLKVMIEEKPDMVKFKVVKKGEGLKTEYTVIPLD